jgi:hypothetical protein
MNNEKKVNSIADAQVANSSQNDMYSYVLKRYNDSISYYWRAAGVNKRTYKFNRSFIIILGATVTLLSSLFSASFVKGSGWLETVFAVATPVSAAVLTILNGFTQSFQSGAAWRDMVLNAERLEKERDRYLALSEEDRNYKRELSILNKIIVNESTAFFKRILESEYQPEEDENNE